MNFTTFSNLNGTLTLEFNKKKKKLRKTKLQNKNQANNSR